MKELRELGLLVKEVPYINNIGYSERTNSIIEPKLSTQWFCKMNELAKPAINVVTNNQIKFYPDKYKIYIYIGWTILKIGVFLGNYGGDKEYQLTILITENM